MSGIAEDCLVIVDISSSAVSAIVAWKRDGDKAERPVASKTIEVKWHTLTDSAKREIIYEVIISACNCNQVSVNANSVFISISDESIVSCVGTGYLSFAGPLEVVPSHLDTVLRNATRQAIGTNSISLHYNPISWEITNENGANPIEDPIGKVCTVVANKVRLSVAPMSILNDFKKILSDTGITVESIISQPIALHRGIKNSINKNAIILDFGERYLDVMIQEKSILHDVKTWRFGGHDITKMLSSNFSLSYDLAENYKTMIDIDKDVKKQDAIDGQISFLREISEQDKLYKPMAIAIKNQLVEVLRQVKSEIKDEVLAGKAIYLFGKAIKMKGFESVLKEVFVKNRVYIGTNSKRKMQDGELSNRMLTGLVVVASEKREQNLNNRAGAGIHKVKRAWRKLTSWLFYPLAH